MLLDYKNKFNIQTSERFVPKASSTVASSPAKKTTSTWATIESPGFQKWTNVNMYRTSYNDMSNRVRYNSFDLDLGYTSCEKKFPYSRLSRIYPRKQD